MEHVLNVSVSAINAVSVPPTYGFTFDDLKSKAPTLPPSNLNLDAVASPFALRSIDSSMAIPSVPT